MSILVACRVWSRRTVSLGLLSCSASALPATAPAAPLPPSAASSQSALSRPPLPKLAKSAPAPNAPPAGRVKFKPATQPVVVDEPWPPVYTVELYAGGSVYADGERMPDLGHLAKVARRGTSGGQWSTAVFFAEPSSSESTREVVAAVLRGSGFARVLSVDRGAPLPIRKAPRSRPPVRRKKSSPQSRRSRRPKVSVQTVGLHVGGGARSEASRQKLVRRFEKHLPAMARCHVFSKHGNQNALYGIDVTVPRSGGKPTLGEVRSRLKSSKFRRCMAKVIGAIRFKVPEKGRNTTISYSLLFKPLVAKKKRRTR